MNAILKNLYQGDHPVKMMIRNGEKIYQQLTKFVFEVDKDSIEFQDTGGTDTITIAASEPWTMTVPSWLTASAVSGRSSATITLTSQPTQTSLQGNIVITCAGIQKTVSVTAGIKYFRITNRTSNEGTITLAKNKGPDNVELSVRVNGGNWSSPVTYSGTTTFVLPANGYVDFDGSNNNSFSKGANGDWRFNVDVDYDVSGDLYTLVSSKTSKYGEFQSLFYQSTHLINASGLNMDVTSLAESCYSAMFANCSNLISTPEIPGITTLGGGCFQSFFQGCAKVNYIKCLAIPKNQYPFANWVLNVSPTGTFVKAAGVTWPTGASGIPSGWTVIEE